MATYPPSVTYYDITDVFPDASPFPQDPSGESLGARTATSGSNAWVTDLHNVTVGAAQPEPQLFVIEGEEATDRNNYFQARVVKSAVWTAVNNKPAELRCFHRPVVASGDMYYVAMADLIGASAIVPVNVAPSTFYFAVGFQMYDSGWILIDSVGAQIARIGGDPDTGGFGISSSGAGTTYDPAVVSSQSITIPINYNKNGDSLSRATSTVNGVTPSNCAYVLPFVTLRFNVVSTSGSVATSLIQDNTTLEYRFDNLRIFSPGSGIGLNAVTKLNGLEFPNYGNGDRFWNQRLYSDTDPTYATLSSKDPYDIYDDMSVRTPSIGTRIDRECFVEQIRHDVSPGEDSWKMTLGLSDAITGAYWALDSSRLGVDTRLGI
jgi:hypothetical protein